MMEGSVKVSIRLLSIGAYIYPHHVTIERQAFRSLKLERSANVRQLNQVSISNYADRFRLGPIMMAQIQ